ncbi:hypothetical protein KIN20_029880 [Parelaphostrongylus tenuis]|uniref:Uncharacterized protein n=1 Tax=Parelaphostrongylus tenuis TaxID=148309 RepID=A0AAD5R2Z6_PARTN|nr:hypothetical protein KIN20_029880 [Parelaphostrongylus tenuis]
MDSTQGKFEPVLCRRDTVVVSPQKLVSTLVVGDAPTALVSISDSQSLPPSSAIETYIVCIDIVPHSYIRSVPRNDDDGMWSGVGSNRNGKQPGSRIGLVQYRLIRNTVSRRAAVMRAIPGRQGRESKRDTKRIPK